MTVRKAKIVDALAGTSLLLPDRLADALAANARIKFALSWLQVAEAFDAERVSFADLAPERALAGLADDPLYAPPAAIARGAKELEFVGARAIVARLLEDVGCMVAATEAGAEAGALDPQEPAQFRVRKEEIVRRVTLDGDRLPNGLVSLLSQPRREGRDTLHGLVMDMHKALNAIAASLSEEDILGARVFRLEDDDKARVAAFMRGLNRTRRSNSTIRGSQPRRCTTARGSSSRTTSARRTRMC